MTAFTAYRTGNWNDISNTGPWYNGITITAYPGQLNTSDSVTLGNYVVALNVSPAYPISSLSAMTASGGITVSGTYTLVVTSMITCGTNTNGIIYVAAGGNLTLGNSSTPLSITGASAPAIVVAMGTPGGTATIYANITGGSSTNAYGLSNAGTCTIYGNVTGGMMTGAYGVYCSSGTTTIYGNVTASSSAHALYGMGGNVNVINTASAPAVISAPCMSYNGIYNSGTAMVYLTGCVLVYPNSSGMSNAPVYGSFTWTKNAFSGFRMATDSSTTYYASTYYSDPGVNNVLSGTTYSYGGTNNKTGAYVLPNNAGVSSLVTYGVSGGTTGGLASSKIMDATYGALSVSSVLSTAGGTYQAVAAANVRHGTPVGQTTGTAYIPSAADVRSGTNVDATTGTLAVPSATVVLTGNAVDNTTGTYWPPPPASVVNTQNFGAGSNGTTGGTQGTLDLAGDEASYYANGQAAQLAADSTAVAGYAASILSTATILGTTGTVTLPPQGKVQNDTSYGAAGTQLTGTIDLTCCVPANIKNNVIIAGVTGTLETSATGMLTLYA